jgi:membrane protein implicated in regulation of membrane protease activity
LSGDTATYDTKGSNKGKLVGKIATVTKAIRAGSGIGMVTIKNDPWRVRSKEEIPEGSKVRVVGTEGEFLMVARAE